MDYQKSIQEYQAAVKDTYTAQAKPELTKQWTAKNNNTAGLDDFDGRVAAGAVYDRAFFLESTKNARS